MSKTELAKELFRFAEATEPQVRSAGLEMCKLLLDQMRMEALLILEEADALHEIDAGSRFLQAYRERGGGKLLKQQ